MTNADDGTLTIAAAGDAMVTKRLSAIEDGRFRDLRRLIADADASVVNLEGPLHDFEPFPVARRLVHFRSPPWAADELAWMGFDLFSATNNHVGDYSQPGISRTVDELEDRGLAYAGIGENRARARAPAYVETPAGRVALLAATTTYVPGTEAAHGRRDVRGRPGIATLRLRPRYVVTEEHLDAVRELNDALAIDELVDDRGGYVERPEGEGTVPFLDVGAGTAGRTLRFEEGEENRIRYDPHPDDVAEIEEAIRTADRNADRVVLSLHSHEGEGATYNREAVPPAVETFARDCVDAGVDAFLCHGAHRLRGVEIHEGAPVFYGLGNFVLQFDAVPFFPAAEYESAGLGPGGTPVEIQERIGDVVSEDAEKQSVVPVCTFDGDGPCEVRLHPVELGYDRDAADHGTAYLAEDGIAAEILDRLSALSEPYGTGIRTEDGVGIVEP